MDAVSKIWRSTFDEAGTVVPIVMITPHTSLDVSRMPDLKHIREAIGSDDTRRCRTLSRAIAVSPRCMALDSRTQVQPCPRSLK